MERNNHFLFLGWEGKKRDYFLPVFLFTALFFLNACSDKAKEKPASNQAGQNNAPVTVFKGKPNFILVLCDDMGWGDIEPNGGLIPTPSISKLAKEGLIATDYYSPANICSPARAGILTGRYPIRTGLGYEVILFDDKRTLPVSEQTIANLLKPDYATALIGKWHLGHTGTKWLPTNYGFDLFYGIPYSHDILPLPLYDADAKSGKLSSTRVDGSPELQQMFYKKAETFIDANKDKPFFLELALSAPHLPEHPNRVFKGKSTFGAYGDVMMEIDSIIGRLLSKLRDLHLDKNTVVVLTSDNGAWFEGSNNPLRDRKGGPGYDGGYRVPFIAWAPAIIKPGKTGAILSGIDLLPTFVSMAGLSLPRNLEIDGKDISGVLTKGEPSPHDGIFLFNNEDIVGVRTQKWKYVTQTTYRGLTIPLEAVGFPELYDMSRDIAENYSVAATYPDTVKAMQDRIKKGQAYYASFKKGIPEAILKKKQEMHKSGKQD